MVDVTRWGTHLDIVYQQEFGSNGEDCVVFAPRDRAHYVAKIARAIEKSTTWGEFRRNLPAGEWEGYFLERIMDDAEELDASYGGDVPFDPDQIPGYPDGDYPPWLAREQLSWFPDDLVAKYDGEFTLSVLNGPSLNLPATRAEEIAAELRHMGHTVEPATEVWEVMR